MFPILSVSETEAAAGQRQRSPLNWPIADLDVGQSFVIPTANGRDHTGRREDAIRVSVVKKGQVLNRRFSCRKVENGLMIVRLA